MPTLLHLTRHPIPDWAEGTILPPYADIINPNAQERIFAVQAKYNEPTYPLTEVSVAHIRDNFKLTYYLGYNEVDEKDKFQLFDIEEDPEELNDLSISKPETASELLNIVKKKLEDVNKPYGA